MNDRILIVCEGRKSEPKHFRKLGIACRVPTARIIIRGDGDSAPIGVVKYARKFMENDPEFDKVFIVLMEISMTRTYGQ